MPNLKFLKSYKKRKEKLLKKEGKEGCGNNKKFGKEPDWFKMKINKDCK